MDASTKTKLDICKVYDSNELQCLVSLYMSRIHRSLVSKMLCGVFPLMAEVDRFKDTDRQICKDGVTEIKEHFLYKMRRTRKCQDKAPHGSRA